MVILLLFLFNFLSASDSDSDSDNGSRQRTLSVLTEDRVRSTINGMLHLLDDAERIRRNTGLFSIVDDRTFTQILRDYRDLSEENAAEVRTAFTERWNQQLVPLLSGLSPAQLQEAVPMINSFIGRTAQEVVSQAVENIVNNFLEEGTFEINDELRDFIAQSEVYQGTPGTPQGNLIVPVIDNSPYLPLPADENLIIAGLLQNPQGDEAPPRNLIPGSPLREEVNENAGEEGEQNPQGFTTPPTNAGQPRTAGQARLAGSAQGRNVRPRLNRNTTPPNQLYRAPRRDDENGPDGGGIPVN